jgi:hypothetical protein
LQAVQVLLIENALAGSAIGIFNLDLTATLLEKTSNNVGKSFVVSLISQVVPLVK